MLGAGAAHAGDITDGDDLGKGSGAAVVAQHAVGPAAHLREVGVEVAVDAPGGGENLQDHPEGVIMWEARQPMPAASSQWWEAGIFYDTEPDLDRPDLMFHYGSVPFDMNIARHG